MRPFLFISTIILILGGLLFSTQSVSAKILPEGGLVPNCERTNRSVTVGQSAGEPVTNRPCTVDDFVQMLINLIEWFLVVLGASAFLMFFYGGILFVFSFGNKKFVEQGRNILSNTVIAILVILGAYTALKIVVSALGVVNSL